MSAFDSAAFDTAFDVGETQPTGGGGRRHVEYVTEPPIDDDELLLIWWVLNEINS